MYKFARSDIEATELTSTFRAAVNGKADKAEIKSPIDGLIGT